MKPTVVRKTRFNKWVWRNFPHCKDVVKLITARMDGRLSLFDAIKMKIHLLSCPPCVNFLNQLKFLRLALRKEAAAFKAENSSAKLSDEAQIRMKKAIENAVNPNNT